MGRIPRNRLGAGVFHVLNRSINGEWILKDDADKEALLEFFVKFQTGLGLNIYHWAIMSNHFHLAIEALNVTDLSSYVGKVSRRFSLYHHQRHGGSGPLWARRYKSILVQREGYLQELGRYIERNTLRADLVENAWDYPFCSAAAYVSGRSDGLVNPDDHPLWPGLASSAAKRRRAYASFLQDDREVLGMEALFRSEQPVVGDEAFIVNVRRERGRATSRGRGRKRNLIK
ncbi:MAG: transposase [Verrucomicrobia bacterium]|nr:transposase [Verrucomicrobiota bacterium]